MTSSVLLFIEIHRVSSTTQIDHQAAKRPRWRSPYFYVLFVSHTQAYVMYVEVISLNERIVHAQGD